MQADSSTQAPCCRRAAPNFKLRQLMRRANHYDAEMAKCGIKTTQYLLLSHVLKLGPIRPGDLARDEDGCLHAHAQPAPAGRCRLVTLQAGTDARSRLRAHHRCRPRQTRGGPAPLEGSATGAE